MTGPSAHAEGPSWSSNEDDNDSKDIFGSIDLSLQLICGYLSDKQAVERFVTHDITGNAASSRGTPSSSKSNMEILQRQWTGIRNEATVYQIKSGFLPAARARHSSIQRRRTQSFHAA